MATLEVTTLTGDAVALESTTLAAFQAQLRGPMLCPSDAGYEAARTLWNAHIATRPALLVRCMGRRMCSPASPLPARTSS